MALIETPIHWLWLARGSEIRVELSAGDRALMILDNFERSIGEGGRLPLIVPLIWMSVRPGSHPSIESLIAAQLVRLLERARAVRLRNPQLYGILKSKGIRGGASSGASGSQLVDSVELGLACFDCVLSNTTGFNVLLPGRVGALLLPHYVQENNNEPDPSVEVPRVSRYNRKWVI
jgi:hypothetical protein